MSKGNGKKLTPPIVVRVPKTDRLKAINNLAAAILELSKALGAVPQVTIAHNTIQATGNGIDVGFSEDELEDA